MPTLNRKGLTVQLLMDEIFVFGSNKAGNHAGGAARQAHEQFGAEMGVGEGLTGRSYAFPTLDDNFKKLTAQELMDARDHLYETCALNPDKTFLLTRVGTGIAGFPDKMMADLFFAAPINIIKPEGW